MIDNSYIRLNRIIALLIFIVTFTVYFDTMAPTVSYWDCGEFIAVSHTLGVPHPPGSPFFLLMGRIFSMLPFNEDIAFRVNVISPLVSALAVMLLYLSTVKVITHWRGKVNNITDVMIVFGGAAVGALTFAFTDSHWFNAVEAEVYAFSTFFTAIVVWLILLWNEKADERGHERYILIIAYMFGLAIGVHILNLLTLPFLALIIYFRKTTFEWKTFFITMGMTAAVFLVIHNGIITNSPAEAADGSDMVFMCVGNDKDVEEVVKGKNGVLSSPGIEGILGCDPVANTNFFAFTIKSPARSVLGSKKAPDSLMTWTPIFSKRS